MSSHKIAANEIAEQLSHLQIIYEQKNEADDWWHYHNRHLSKSVSFYTLNKSLLFSDTLHGSEMRPELFNEQNELSEYSSLQFTFLGEPGLFKVSRILNSSKFLPVEDNWTFTKSCFIRFLKGLFNQDAELIQKLSENLTYLIKEVQESS